MLPSETGKCRGRLALKLERNCPSGRAEGAGFAVRRFDVQFFTNCGESFRAGVQGAQILLIPFRHAHDAGNQYDQILVVLMIRVFRGEEVLHDGYVWQATASRSTFSYRCVSINPANTLTSPSFRRIS